MSFNYQHAVSVNNEEKDKHYLPKYIIQRTCVESKRKILLKENHRTPTNYRFTANAATSLACRHTENINIYSKCFHYRSSTNDVTTRLRRLWWRHRNTFDPSRRCTWTRGCRAQPRGTRGRPWPRRSAWLAAGPGRTAGTPPASCPCPAQHISNSYLCILPLPSTTAYL